MTEPTKRFICIAGIGWFLGGHTTVDIVMFWVSWLVLFARMSVFAQNGDLREWVKTRRHD